MNGINNVTVLLFYLICSILLITGCASPNSSDNQEISAGPEEVIEEVIEHEKIVMYENTDRGIRVYETPNWEFGEQSEGDQINVTFYSEKGKAIITVLSSKKDLEEIKQELMIGVGKSNIIEETDNYFAFQSERKESIRSDVYFEQQDQRVNILTFMTPVDDYEENIEYIKEFKQHIEFY
ncbi:hypothetical protein [Halalkalibacter alkaliphilus]|uniref:Uncharacterized protein n=1 Tax=Halalkalibacter alkaliphilus TaxID=2917993 RepID=A0A9X2CTK1_9BACI|nr:hypothetical protein [Halalkalibacter alkaliphilus]MCL7748002.1 hypothetical protein [Halalkalibacter alkaliphilus]